jgi:hypothetical protein
MSAETIRFIARPSRERQPSDFPVIAFRSVLQSEKPAPDAEDTAPCEYMPPVDGNC